MHPGVGSARLVQVHLDPLEALELTAQADGLFVAHQESTSLMSAMSTSATLRPFA